MTILYHSILGKYRKCYAKLDLLTILRLLEHKLEESDKGTAQKVYIFNTFFYARLTSGGHGHRSFNFEAVAKWTSKIDIFSYDYVVVPINEK